MVKYNNDSSINPRQRKNPFPPKPSVSFANCRQMKQKISLLQKIATAAKLYFTTKNESAWISLLKSISELSNQHVQTKQPHSPIEYYPIYECETFLMCVFVLQKGSYLPIHDHPSMTVISKIVFGDLHVRTFEIDPNSKFTSIIHPTTQQSLSVVQAMAGVNRILSNHQPESVLVLHPEHGPSMHCFTAVSDHVILFDILSPPYHSKDRPCSYFKEVLIREYDSFGSEIIKEPRELNISGKSQTCWLSKEEPNPDYECIEREYPTLAPISILSIQ